MTITADLSGKTAFITGASGSFGAHFARLLSSAGAAVIVAARRITAVEALVAEINANGGAASAVTLDVTDTSSIAAAISAAGPVDILVNNAGIANTRSVLDQTEADWDSIIDTNLKGYFLVGSEIARSMKAAATSGSIINIASILGLRQGGGVTPYAVSKAGVIQMTKQFALELARFNIRVNAIAPGYVETDLNRAFFASDAGQALIKRIPQRRIGSVTDLDGPLLLLASESSRGMTGSVITVDGGHMVSSL